MKQITAKLDKSNGDGTFTKAGHHKLKDLGGETAGALTARYYKGISADCDNVVIELYALETHQQTLTVSQTKSIPQKES